MGIRHLYNLIKVNLFFDKSFYGIKKNIKPLVLALWDLGYKTSESGDGTFSKGKNYPFVILPIKNNKLDTLAEMICEYNKSNEIKWKLYRCYYPYDKNKNDLYYELFPKESNLDSVISLTNFLN